VHTSSDIIRVIKLRRMKWAVHVACMGEMRKAYNILVGKPEGKRPFENRKYRWECNIITDLREVLWEGVDWMHLTHDSDQ
jgi:hypothetical protein